MGTFKRCTLLVLSTFTGLLWDMEAKTVALPAKKCEKYLAAIIV